MAVWARESWCPGGVDLVSVLSLVSMLSLLFVVSLVSVLSVVRSVYGAAPTKGYRLWSGGASAASTKGYCLWSGCFYPYYKL